MERQVLTAQVRKDVVRIFIVEDEDEEVGWGFEVEMGVLGGKAWS